MRKIFQQAHTYVAVTEVNLSASCPECFLTFQKPWDRVLRQRSADKLAQGARVC